MTAQRVINGIATAIDKMDQILGELLAHVAQLEEASAQAARASKELLHRVVDARRELQKKSDEARAAAVDIHNERRRYQREVGATSLREIA